MRPDTIAEAVLARADVSRFLEGSHGLSSAAARTKVLAYLDELQTTQRYELYRALEYPLYPILRKIERVGEHQQLAVDAGRRGASSTPRTTAAISITSSNRWSWTMRGSGRRSSRPASTCSAARSA
jgi:hypothetical protein